MLEILVRRRCVHGGLHDRLLRLGRGLLGCGFLGDNLDRVCLRGGGLSGNDALVGEPLLQGRVQRRMGRNVGSQILARGSNVCEVLRAQRGIAHVSSSELRRIDGAHLYSSRTRKCSS